MRAETSYHSAFLLPYRMNASLMLSLAYPKLQMWPLVHPKKAPVVLQAQPPGHINRPLLDLLYIFLLNSGFSTGFSAARQQEQPPSSASHDLVLVQHTVCFVHRIMESQNGFSWRGPQRPPSCNPCCGLGALHQVGMPRPPSMVAMAQGEAESSDQTEAALLLHSLHQGQQQCYPTSLQPPSHHSCQSHHPQGSHCLGESSGGL